MLINENIGAVISNADTIEIKFSDNDGLDKDHINKNNDRESEEKINENRKEELDYYIREAFNQNTGQGEGFDRDFSEKYYSEDEYEFSDDYNFDDEYEFEDEYLSEETEMNFENEIYEGVLDFNENVHHENEDEEIAEKNMENLKPYDIYSGRNVRYAEWDILNDYIAAPDGNIKDWKLISRMGYFSNQKNRLSFEDRTRDKIITLMNSAGIGIYASNVTEEGNVIFEMMPITDFNSSLKINEKKI